MDILAVRPDILEVTLRDGSYLIDFQFTAQDTAVIASALETVGFRWIEVGHGLGLNASASGKGRAAATDEEYLEAAAEAVKTAHWGMFFIPGIGREDDLRLAARYGMHFVRIGTNVTEVDRAEGFIKQTKDLGMFVSYNGMKSYAVSPVQWGRCAAAAHGWGADIVCLVDSAGGMQPDDVSAYLKAARSQSPGPLGFHGHDNLSLSMANTLRAIDDGAVLVDSSLQGMGRSAGNAITEVLVAVLKKRGLLPEIDMKAVMDAGAGLIRPLMGRRGVDPLAVTSGYANFHSSFTPKVQRYAEKHGVDVRDLIVRLCEEDLVSAPDDLLERLGRELAIGKAPNRLPIPAFRLGGDEPAKGREALESLLRTLRPRAVKAGRSSALNAVIAETPLQHITVSGNIQDTPSHVAASVSYTTDQQLETILRSVEGRVDVLLLDVDRKPFGPTAPAATAARILEKTALVTYLDSRVWANSVEEQVVRFLSEHLEGVPIVIAGNHPKSRLLATALAERRAQVTLVWEKLGATPELLRAFSFSPDVCEIVCCEAVTAEARDRLAAADLVVVWPSGAPWFGRSEARLLRPEAAVFDAGIGGLLPDALAELQECAVVLIRGNMWPSLAGTLLSAHESQRVQREAMGHSSVAGVPVVAGGAWGRSGDVVVDSVRHPTRVIGVANGQGGFVFRHSHEEAERVRRVTAAINSQMLMPPVASGT